MSKPLTLTSRQLPRTFALLLLFCFIYTFSHSQSKLDSLLQKINPQKWSSVIEKKSDKLTEKILSKSEKVLARMQRQDEKLCRKISFKDSTRGAELMAGIQNKYSALRDKLKSGSTNCKNNYIPYLDSIQTAFRLLDQQGIAGNIKSTLEKTKALQSKFQQAEEIKKFIRERKQQLKEQLEKLGLVKELKKINKEVFYYSEQLKEYKALLSDPKKIERKAIDLLSKTKLFRDFFKKNSMLASLFRMPGDPNDPAYLASLSGLQTRAQVNGLIQQQIVAAGPNGMQQFQQNIQAAQVQLNQLKSKVLKSGQGSSDDIMPEGFQPNNERKKSFLKRLEYGTNFQTQKATGYFPITSDIGLSVGYKLNDKSIIGIGGSWKMGWGRGWQHINITAEGLSLRSFMDWKIKGNFYLSGGFEQNYKSNFTAFNQLRNLNAWQESGLIGISKSFNIKSRVFKKAKIQLLWDFLSADQLPKTQPIIFRIGYNF